jgi:hypothetical protein
MKTSVIFFVVLVGLLLSWVLKAQEQQPAPPAEDPPADPVDAAAKSIEDASRAAVDSVVNYIHPVSAVIKTVTDAAWDSNHQEDQVPPADNNNGATPAETPAPEPEPAPESGE